MNEQQQQTEPVEFFGGPRCGQTSTVPRSSIPKIIRHDSRGYYALNVVASQGGALRYEWRWAAA